MGALLSKYFGIQGDVETGVEFEVDGIGKIYVKQEKKSLHVNIEPPKKICGDYDIIKKWNNFLFEATGRTTRERKKIMSKEIMT